MSPSALVNDGEIPSGSPRLLIEIPPAAAADNLSEISAITKLVNLVFIEAEAGIWNNGFVRISDAEVAELIRKGQLALAYLASPALASGKPPAERLVGKGQLVGCVCIKRISDSICTLSMLALDKTYQGLGLGREIFQFVEDYCLSLGCTTLGLDILVPTSYDHPLKTRMQAWYKRLGFQEVRLADFAEEYPALAPLLSGPVVYRVFEKKLR
ncbi:acyl-CoA N-acyltransferase [Trichoderma novae-zelandiae]